MNVFESLTKLRSAEPCCNLQTAVWLTFESALYQLPRICCVSEVPAVASRSAMRCRIYPNDSGVMESLVCNLRNSAMS